MSVIINEMKKHITTLKTTSDLIYKDKKITPHNIAKQYKEMEENGEMYNLFLKYGDQPLYLSKTEEAKKAIAILQVLHANLCDIVFKQKDEKIDSNKIMQNEIFNSLWIEGVRSSKKAIKQFLKKPDENVDAKMAKYAHNYSDALNFIATTSAITEENLYGLYINLSRDIDFGEDKLDGFPYREGMVEIGSPTNLGIKPENISKSMKTIFEAAEYNAMIDNDYQNAFYNKSLTAIAIHYLFELVHPYYDMNGRMGRLITLWFANINKMSVYFENFSEAMNLFKKELYYDAFKMSTEKDFKFDVTYFTQSILFALAGQKLAEALLYEIDNDIKTVFKEKLSNLQKDILMSIITKENKWYLLEDFVIGISKINQGQLSTAVSQLVSYGILEETNTKPKEYKFIWSKGNLSFINKNIKKAIKQIEEIKERL